MFSVNVASLSTDLREALQSARRMGFAGAQLPLKSPGLVLPELARTGQRELMRRVGEVGLKLSSLTTSAGRAGLMPSADVDRAIAHLEGAVRCAADLGRVVLCVDLGPLPAAPVEPTPVPKPVDPGLLGVLLLPEAPPTPAKPAVVPPPPDPAWSEVTAALVELGRRADRYGALVAFRSSLASLAAVHHLLATTRCPLFGLDYDPVAVLQDDWDADRVLAAFAGRIWHLRARDGRRGHGGRTQPTVLGEGDTRLPELLRGLDAAGFSGPKVVDPVDLTDRPSAAATGLEVLRAAEPGH
jgi:sugar phosphate isomerase/epimerase